MKRHRWENVDTCLDCGTTRHGYQGGRTGSLVYRTANGVESSRAPNCERTAKPAEAVTCAIWCGTEVGPPESFRVFSSNTRDYCTKECLAARKPLHPATEQAATCGTCGGTGNPYWDRSVYWDHPEKRCPDCPTTAEQEGGNR